MKVSFSSYQKRHFQKKLLHWYQRNKRDLPWRNTKDPYRIWISEIMLQQTRISTVLPYYKKFLREFPTMRSLARARLQKVLKSWEGLGYYGRGRNLHRTARFLVANHHARFPSSHDELSRLPGFGPYTTAAVLSLAYGKPYAVVDGNVVRVLTRLLGYSGDIQSSRTKSKLLSTAGEMLDPRNPGNFNQAMMELGATVCTPSDPACEKCPVSGFCHAGSLPDPTIYPVSKKKQPPKKRYFVIGLICRSQKVLMRQRKTETFMGDMWEFPTLETQKSKVPRLLNHSNSQLKRDAAYAAKDQKWQLEFENKLRMKIKDPRPIYQSIHSYSHFTGHYSVFRIRGNRSSEPGGLYRWVPFSKVRQLPLARIHRMIAQNFLIGK